MRGMLVFVPVIAVLFFASSAFAGICPPGASDCFLCGGIGGIPCAASDSCSGAYVEGVGNVACECPQDEECQCHCPYSEYGALKEQAGAIGETVCLPRCTYGCSADMSICITEAPGTVGGNGLAMINAIQGEVLVRMAGGGWARATEGTRIAEGAMIRTGKDGKVSLLLDDGSKIFMEEETTLDVNLLKPRPAKTTLDVILVLIEGALFSDVTKRDSTKFEVDTGVSVTGVKGTQFLTTYDGTTAETKVFDGEVDVADRYGNTVVLENNQKVAVTSGGVGVPSEFDPSQEDKWWESSGGCCSGAILMALLAGATAFAGSKR
ncbi:MAG: FecR family protein [Candidatus ainarchaeum sp.]|nr:FecR family protein [Candidatus ainarchaeum sp.]